ncbi:uncharacterized protein FRV6_08559 [Fusarium oxysporum]|uniref:Uncharacterized protein n=1 Tax=Fusarium oxysporum TaxID=5507 RepID=A0A2H3T6U9_FUSOX|nr:uncharacterized protein FRV6_08559 [Fusarium oxysporum]
MCEVDRENPVLIVLEIPVEIRVQLEGQAFTVTAWFTLLLASFLE